MQDRVTGEWGAALLRSGGGYVLGSPKGDQGTEAGGVQFFRELPWPRHEAPGECARASASGRSRAGRLAVLPPVAWSRLLAASRDLPAPQQPTGRSRALANNGPLGNWRCANRRIAGRQTRHPCRRD